eukprot:Nk52_evm21s1992 gene=Nk52_evmTU21s1992
MANAIRKRKSRRSKVAKTPAKKGQSSRSKFYHKIRIEDEAVKKQWDKSLTLKQNMVKLGLCADPNGDISTLNSIKGQESMTKESVESLNEEQEQERTALIKEFEERAKCGVQREVHPSDGQLDFVKKMSEKYGDDFKAMSKDLKLNYMQKTPKQIKKMFEKFAKYL